MRNLLTPRELARLCGVSPDTVRGWCKHNQIKFAIEKSAYCCFHSDPSNL